MENFIFCAVLTSKMKKAPCSQDILLGTKILRRFIKNGKKLNEI